MGGVGPPVTDRNFTVRVRRSGQRGSKPREEAASMAHEWGGLARQGALAHGRDPCGVIVVLLLSGISLTFGGRLHAAPLLVLKTRQVQRLERMVARKDCPRRNAALLELCRSERELALLAPDRQRWLGAAATSCRRLLFDAPMATEADQALLLLAQVEQERARPVRALEAVAELERRWPQSPRLCSALLLGAEAQASRCDASSGHGEDKKERDKAAARGACRERLVTELQRVARHTSCAVPRSALLKQAARYRLAWELVRTRKQAEGRVELRRLWLDSSTGSSSLTGFRQRLLRDLARVWASFGPDPDTVGLLVGQGPLGAELVVQVAEGLAEQQGLARLLSFVDLAQQEFSRKETWQALELQRWSGLARSASVVQLQQRLVRLTDRLSADSRFRQALGAQLLAAASRLERQPRSLGGAEWIYRRLTQAPFLATGSQRAQSALARLLMKRGAHQEALPHLRVLVRLCQQGEGSRLRSCDDDRYRWIYALEQVRGETPSRAQLEEIAVAAACFIRASAKEPRRKDPRRSAVRLLLARTYSELGRHQAALGVAQAGLKRVTKKTMKPAPLRVEAIRAARSLHRFAVLHGLVQALQGERWRSMAAEAALLEAERLAGTDLAASRRWAEEAIKGHEKKLILRARLFAAKLAARAGDTRALDRHLAALVRGAPHRGSAITRQRATWLLAGGDLKAAAAAHLQGGLDETALLQAARLLLWLGDTKHATPLLLRVRRRLLAADAAKKISGQVLEAGRLLEGVLPRRAYGFYLQRAMTGWRQAPGLAGRCLARAAALALSPRRAWQLAEQAVEVAGRPVGRRALAAVHTRIAVAAILRRQIAGLSPELVVERLSRLIEWLAPALELRIPRLSTAAAAEMAWAFGTLARHLPKLGKGLASRAVALRQRRDQLWGVLVKMAVHPAGLDGHTLAALRRSRGVARGLALTHVPGEGSIQGPTLRLLRAKRWAAAEAVASAGLDLHGPRAPLLCARAVARAKAGKVAEAVADLQHAYELAPESRCARLNLATVALWRADVSLARKLLPRARQGAPVADLVQWLQRAQIPRFSVLSAETSP
ncbi:MAG: hypothetical protein JRH20_11825 [Deltaproteobacteria bacterium]|nr:hypothetical protein [Deltaproteobacteria bacterium]